MYLLRNRLLHENVERKADELHLFLFIFHLVQQNSDFRFCFVRIVFAGLGWFLAGHY